MNEAGIRDLFLKKITEILVTDKAKLSVSQEMLPNFLQSHYQPDMLAELKFGGKSTPVIIEFKANGRPGTVSQVVSQLKKYAEAANALPMFVAPHIGPQARGILRENRVFFADLSGNKWIEFDGLYIDADGHASKFPEKRNDRDPFADKASLVLRAMFEQPEKRWRVHELADAIGVTPGFVSKITNTMKQRGYISKDEDGLRLMNARSILDDWVYSYSYRKNQEYKYFCMATSAKEIIGRLKNIDQLEVVDYALALQAGAHLVAPHAEFDLIHVYIKNQVAHEKLVNLLNLQGVGKGQNVVILDPYYRQSVFYGKRKVDGIWVVSDLQLYIDLYNYPLRGLEQAEHLYRKKLAKISEQISEKRSHVR
ncbi:MAG TPA: type IV toxin-antitoxin system AbiEi family antitoxin [Anaerolineae bacterium]|nr:type IV toxin-antitoxin system AbiEi family antitoxin [Anaerolineae bacterium]